MLKLKKILLKTQSTPSPEPSTEAKEELEKIQVATCALLLEVARSDNEFSSLEKDTVNSILNKEFNIPPQAIQELIEFTEGKLKESVDLWEFTHLINENFSKQEKIKTIEWMWKVIYADEKLSGYEDHLVHKLARLLNLDHEELIQAKLKVLKR